MPPPTNRSCFSDVMLQEPDSRSTEDLDEERLARSIAKKSAEIDELIDLISRHPEMKAWQSSDQSMRVAGLDAYDLFLKAAIDTKPEHSDKAVPLYVECIKELRKDDPRVPIHQRSDDVIDAPENCSPEQARQAMRSRLEHKWKNETTQILAMTNLAIRLMTALKYRNDDAAMRFLKICANCSPLMVHECELLHGEALVYGRGGVVRNVSKGMQFLHRAAFGGMGLLAYFVIGSVYEQGCDDCSEKIDQNLSAARHFYELATKTAGENGYMEKFWHPEISTVRIFLRTPEFHTLSSELSIMVGERFNWALAAQSFLYGATVGLAAGVQPDHYSPLLIVLPILGIILGIFSTLQIFETLVRNMIRGDSFHKLIDAKLDAYFHILEKVGGKPFCKFCAREIGRCHFGVHRKGNPWFTLCWFLRYLAVTPGHKIKPGSEIEKERWRYVKVNGFHIVIRRLSFWVGLSCLLVAFAFLGAWIAILINEIRSFEVDCGDWWYSTCRGSVASCETEVLTKKCINTTCSAR